MSGRQASQPRGVPADASVAIGLSLGERREIDRESIDLLASGTLQKMPTLGVLSLSQHQPEASSCRASRPRSRISTTRCRKPEHKFWWNPIRELGDAADN